MKNTLSTEIHAKQRAHHPLIYVLAASVVLAVATVYWPVVHANFVWDDWLDFHDMAWLREGSEWQHFILANFNNWTNYFRPLVVALLTLQVRMFNGMPGSMHAVSLGMHLVNTLLVGMLSWRFSSHLQTALKQALTVTACMLLYGFHPVLIESVAWIGCQFDLAATMFMLLGLLANACVKNVHARAATVSIIFFLAACSKESAVSFPLLLLVFDWALLSSHKNGCTRKVIRVMVGRNWKVYLAVFFSGIAYLVFRHWAIGAIVNPFATSSSSMFGRLQETSFIYLRYWKMLISPMSGMSPIHPVDLAQFEKPSATSLMIDIASIGIVTIGFVLTLWRSSAFAFGCILLAVSAAMLPALHIASVNFDNSLYHERYVMTALAVACALLPLVRFDRSVAGIRKGLAPALIAAFLTVWLVSATISIRVMLPLWSSNVQLWQWAISMHPYSIEAQDGLLSAYIDTKDYVNAHALIDRLMADNVPCTNCMLNAAILAIKENDPARAAMALGKVRSSRELVADKQMFRMYLLTTGQMLVLQGQPAEAEPVLQSAMRMNPLDPEPQISLAMTLALEGKINEAFQIGSRAIALLAPNEREQRRKTLNDFIAEAAKHRND